MTEPFISINEVSKKLDIPAHTLRYWEKQFPTAIKPATGAGGRRYYRPETVAALEAIKSLLYGRGMTIAGVKKIIKGGELGVGADIIHPIAAKPQQNNHADGVMGQTTSASASEIKKAVELLEFAKAELK